MVSSRIFVIFKSFNGNFETFDSLNFFFLYIFFTQIIKFEDIFVNYNLALFFK